MISPTDKLYIIVRKDLKPGSQLAQSCHCAFQFALEHPEITKNWMNISNYIVILNCLDELEINKFVDQAIFNQINFSIFREPDLENQLTAIALEPGPTSKIMCLGLKPALKEDFK